MVLRGQNFREKNHKLNYTLKQRILEQTKYFLSYHANLSSLPPSLFNIIIYTHACGKRACECTAQPGTKASQLS